MYRKSEEIIDHLFIHCEFASALRLLVFNIFGIQWVMPSGVTGLLACWQGCFGRHRWIGIWNALPHRFMWCIWKERNPWCFEGQESGFRSEFHIS